jgi:eukaryotic-like serine/threonine-protein kinase
VDGRMCHEGAILLANTSHPGLPHVREVGRWPHPIKGYLYIITDHVLGAPFHAWRERARPTVAQFVDVLIEVVRVVERLHAKGIVIRDFKSEHVIIPADHKPVLVDLGSAWLPGGSTLTVGLAPGTPHALPPECVAFIREGSWKQGARFDPGEAGDLYQLGVFMYEALADGWPFDPHLPKDELLVAIETVVPRPPHRINPAVPKSLSLIALRLLEKRPEDRYENAGALLQALWDANKERSTRAWKARLELPPGGPAPVTQEEADERRALQQESKRRAQEARKKKEEELSREQALEQFAAAIQQVATEAEAADAWAARRRKRWRRIALVVGPLLLSLAVFAAGWAWLAPPTASPAASEKGSSLVSTLSNSRPVKTVALWLCATFTVGCPSVPARPPVEEEACPQEAIKGMEALGVTPFQRGFIEAILDSSQPGTDEQLGVYRSGPITSRIVRDKYAHHPLPEGTVLRGYLWTGPGIRRHGREAVYARWTVAELPDGRRYPVCFCLNDPSCRYEWKEGSTPEAAKLPRRVLVEPTNMFP